MIIYNGASGGLGAYIDDASRSKNIRAMPILSRLEDRDGFSSELDALSHDERVVFLQLASMVSVVQCEQDHEAARKVNVCSVVETVNQYVDWATKNGVDAKVVYVSTGHVYKELKTGDRLSESDEARPRSVYAQTKLEAEQQLVELARKKKFRLVICRVFGLLSPKQTGGYLLPALIKRVKENKLDQIPGLDNVRDYIDSRDVCAALMDVCRIDLENQIELINLCSGSGVKIRDVLATILETMSGSDQKRSADEVVAADGRKDDIISIIGDSSKFENCFGYNPSKIPLQKTIADACD